MIRPFEVICSAILGGIISAIIIINHPCIKDKFFNSCKAKALEGKITKHDWIMLGWSTDPTEKAYPNGSFWCKHHLDGNGEGCRPWFRPKYQDEEPK